MAKTALLVEFIPRTRVIVDIPEGMSINEYLEKDENVNLVVRKARANMAIDLPNYLGEENSFVEEDLECPYGSLGADKEL